MEKRSEWFFKTFISCQISFTLHMHSSGRERMWPEAHCHVHYFGAFLTTQCMCLTGYRNHEQGCVKTDTENGQAPSAHPCPPDAYCKGNQGSSPCICKSGFSRGPDGVECTCKNINECLSSPPSTPACDKNAICTDSPGSFYCHCKVGYSGNGRVCSNIDECSQAIHPCNVNATCLDSPGSFHCSCRSGFTGNGFECKGELAFLFFFLSWSFQRSAVPVSNVFQSSNFVYFRFEKEMR